MKEIKFYKYAVLLLVLINLSIVGFLFFTRPEFHQRPPKHEHKARFKNVAMDMLALDQQQRMQFELSAKTHHHKMDSLSNLQRKLLKPYFQSLANVPVKSSNKKSALNEIQRLEGEKIDVTYAHFQEVKSFLKDGQEEGYNRFVDEAVKILLFEPKKKPPPPKDF